mmetsp:Transcript_39486/g.93536  ORF Transcript_39486/g.93536 Transcript_39486/m.93536 type:complete len:372 (-) Transcript_39486:413-1528(-)
MRQRLLDVLDVKVDEAERVVAVCHPACVAQLGADGETALEEVDGQGVVLLHLEHVPQVLQAHRLPPEVSVILADDERLFEVVHCAQVVTNVAVGEAELVQRLRQPDLVAGLAAEHQALLERLHRLPHLASLVVDAPEGEEARGLAVEVAELAAELQALQAVLDRLVVVAVRRARERKLHLGLALPLRIAIQQIVALLEVLHRHPLAIEKVVEASKVGKHNDHALAALLRARQLQRAVQTLHALRLEAAFAVEQPERVECLGLSEAVTVELSLLDGFQVRLRVVVLGFVHPLPLPAHLVLVLLLQFIVVVGDPEEHVQLLERRDLRHRHRLVDVGLQLLPALRNELWRHGIEHLVWRKGSVERLEVPPDLAI